MVCDQNVMGSFIKVKPALEKKSICGYKKKRKEKELRLWSILGCATGFDEFNSQCFTIICHIFDSAVRVWRINAFRPEYIRSQLTKRML